MPKTIDKNLALDLMILLSALESVYLASNQRLPDHLYDNISTGLDELRQIVLGDEND